MSHLNADIRQRAEELVALYPEPRSALIPLCHLAQEQDGWLRREAMTEIAELCGVTAGRSPRHGHLLRHAAHRAGRDATCVSVCTNIACLLGGALELLEHAESTLGVRAGGTTTDGVFTLRRGRVPGRLRPDAVRAGEPPLRRRPDGRELRHACSTICAPAAWPRRCRRTGPWCGCAAAWACRPTGPPSWPSAPRKPRPARPGPPRRPEPGPGPRPRSRPDGDHGRTQDRHGAPGLRRLAHHRALPGDRRLRARCARR